MSRVSYPSPSSSIDSEPAVAPTSSHLSLDTDLNIAPRGLNLDTIHSIRRNLQERDQEFAPRHSAILLTGGPSAPESHEHIDRNRSSLPTSPIQPDDLLTVYNWAPLDSITENSPGNTPPPAPLLATRNLQSPVSPPFRMLRRSILPETNLRRRDFPEDVQMRRALTRELVESPIQDHVDLPQPSTRPTRRSPVALREHRTAPERMSPPLEVEQRFGRSLDEFGRSLEESSRRLSLVDPRLVSQADARIRRNWRQSAQSTTSLLSALSGSLDVQNFSSPASSILPGAALFEEPGTMFPPPEEVQTSNRDSETRPADHLDRSWYNPSGYNSRVSRELSRNSYVYHEDPRHNDLSWEEQRATTQQYSLRQWRYGTHRTSDAEGRSRVHEFVPVTRENMELDEDYDELYLAPDQASPIVRLNPRCDCHSQPLEDSKYYGTKLPFFVNPLPMPLEDTSSLKPSSPQARVYNAIHAGR